MPLLPLVSAAQLLPAALAAKNVATQAAGSFGDLLRDAVDLLPSGSAPVSDTSPPVGNTSSPTGISSLLRDFASSFNQLLWNHNLDSSSGVQLRLNDAGDVEVAGSHPQRSAIQDLLAKTPQLAELFRNIAAQASAQQNAQEFAAFQANSQGNGNGVPLLSAPTIAAKFQMFVKGISATTAFV